MITTNTFFFLLLLLFGCLGVSSFSADEKENIRIYEKSSRAVVNISNIAVNYDFFYRAMPAKTRFPGPGFIITNRKNLSPIIMWLKMPANW
ncbi:MAG: hypothetical protein Ct9H300mP21_07050 [Pseudomonadota bacterium]|nr:MAG: hypothetical protein Ct9H300mP21_07050 [Pseudomonadota bacterium]